MVKKQLRIMVKINTLTNEHTKILRQSASHFGGSSMGQAGEIAIPEIQRPFVLDSSKVRDLMDSLYQGFSVGQKLCLCPCIKAVFNCMKKPILFGSLISKLNTLNVYSEPNCLPLHDAHSDQIDPR
jgi:uncharacterized protein with ParB-like and HNH nuclease domain